MWAVVETYYKHGDYELSIIYTEEQLRYFLEEKRKEYEIEDDDWPDEGPEDLLKMTYRIIEMGEYRVNNQMGYGVREIRSI